MIDTDKYEGHTEGLWFDGEPTKISNAISNAFLQLNPNEIGKANTRLAVDAPLLLAEVKRLREEKELMVTYLRYMRDGELTDKDWLTVNDWIGED